MAGSSAAQTKSVRDAKKRLQRYLRKLDSIPQQVLQEEAPQLYAEIIAETPYKTGKLERSVKVNVAQDHKRPGLSASASARSERGYNYAGIQHEDESFEHPVKGKAHYISEPFARATERIVEKLKDELNPGRNL